MAKGKKPAAKAPRLTRVTTTFKPTKVIEVDEREHASLKAQGLIHRLVTDKPTPETNPTPTEGAGVTEAPAEGEKGGAS